MMGMLVVGLVVLLGSFRYMNKDTPLIELEQDRVVISVSGEPIEGATITINGAFTQASLHLHTGVNYVELRQVSAEDGRFLAAGEVSEIRVVGVQGTRRVDTTAEFSHDERSTRVQHIKWREVEPE